MFHNFQTFGNHQTPNRNLKNKQGHGSHCYSYLPAKKAKFQPNWFAATIFFPRLGPFITAENYWDHALIFCHYFPKLQHTYVINAPWGNSANVDNFVWLLTTYYFTNSNLVSLIFQVEYVMHYYGIAHCVCFGVGLGANVLGKVNI